MLVPRTLGQMLLAPMTRETMLLAPTTRARQCPVQTSALQNRRHRALRHHLHPRRLKRVQSEHLSWVLQLSELGSSEPTSQVQP
jgi:hypothetical protein